MHEMRIILTITTRGWWSSEVRLASYELGSGDVTEPIWRRETLGSEETHDVIQEALAEVLASVERCDLRGRSSAQP